MTSKEAIQELWKLRNCSFKVYQKHKDWQKEIEKYDKIGEVLDIIEKDLDRLEKLEKVIGILKDRIKINVKIFINGGCSLGYDVNRQTIDNLDMCWRYITIEEYELLKEVL